METVLIISKHPEDKSYSGGKWLKIMKEGGDEYFLALKGKTKRGVFMINCLFFNPLRMCVNKTARFKKS